MKNYLIYALFFSFVAVGCSKKCVECADCPDDVTLTDASGNDVTSLEVCEDEFDTKEEYDEAITLTEAFGCECK
ncbi:MAG: hypothetical protein ACON4E_00590 [Flavobacteriales bacterium]